MRRDNSLLSNYHSIAIYLSNFAEIYEQLLYARVWSPYKHGFIPGKSTLMKLCAIIQFLCGVIGKCSEADVIYTDFSHAFDAINHNALLVKISSRLVLRLWFRAFSPQFH